MNASEQRELGALSAKVENLEKQMSSMQTDVRVIRDTITETKGKWKMFLMISGFSAAVGAFITKVSAWVLPFFQNR